MTEYVDSAPQRAGAGETSAARVAMEWLISPLAVRPGVEGRRERLLAWLLVSLLVLIGFAFVVLMAVDGPANPRRLEYSALMFSLGLCFSAAYLLNASGHYRLAAFMAVMLTMLEPWASLLLDSNVVHGDFVPLFYALIAVLLSSFLLSPWITLSVAVVQLGGLAAVAVRYPLPVPFNWASALSLFVIISALGILSSSIMKNDVTQIEEQAQRLAESEAQLRQIVVRDHLTGLFNRRYLEETLQREIARARRSGETVGLITFDLDRFKQVNDAWGHAAGDVVLKRVGESVIMHTRESDLACRCGGDEFVLVLPGASAEATIERARLLRSAVRERQRDAGLAPERTVTASVGLAMFPADGETCEALLGAADEALYRAKRAGGDRAYYAELEIAAQ